MKTDKFNNMISAFQCDLSLAKDPSYRLVKLDRKIKNGDERILKDIELLEELEWSLRNGRAEIHLIDENDHSSQIITPCKRGDDMWRVVLTLGGEIIVVEGKVTEIMVIDRDDQFVAEFYFQEIRKEESANGIYFIESMDYSIWESFASVGQSVFHDKESAEKKAEELREVQRKHKEMK